jgi:hypothetical protein
MRMRRTGEQDFETDPKGKDLESFLWVIRGKARFPCYIPKIAP